MKHSAVLVAALIAVGFVAPARGGDIIADWDSVKLPPKPELKSVTVDPKATALLVLDFMKNNCGQRPRCVPVVPNVKKIIDTARGHNMMIVYNLTGSGKVEDMAD